MSALSAALETAHTFAMEKLGVDRVSFKAPAPSAKPAAPKPARNVISQCIIIASGIYISQNTMVGGGMAVGEKIKYFFWGGG